MAWHRLRKGSLGVNAMVGLGLALIIAFFILKIWTDTIPIPF